MTTVTMLDTSVLCELLQVPGKHNAARSAEVAAEADARFNAGERFVLPITAVIETGNHIAQCDGNRYDVAGRLVRLLKLAMSGQSPWLVLHTQLGADFLTSLCGGDSTGQSLQTLAAARVRAGDIAILVARPVAGLDGGGLGAGLDLRRGPGHPGGGAAMTVPPPYPRLAHLVPGRGTRDDVVLGGGDVATLLAGPVVVEEKLDGANVVLWMVDGIIRCALRSGPGAMDRAGQLGALRAWTAQHDHELRQLLANGTALYAEWLLLTHTVTYDRLPSYLVALDLWRPADGFVGVGERDSLCRSAGITTPPQAWRGVPHDVPSVERLLGPSAWGPQPVEGLVVRSVDLPRRLAKLVRTGFDRTDDEGWKRERPHNRLVDQEASWR